MEDLGERRDYPPEVAGVIRQNEISDYFAAAQQINDSGADVVWLQHEYGIFGGSAGGMILQLLDRVAAPLVRSEERTSELQSLMRNSYAVFCLKKQNRLTDHNALIISL